MRRELRWMVTGLDHVNIATDDGEAMRDFFTDVIGLREGERPAFAFSGYWLYAGDAPIVHINVRPLAAADPGVGSIDHVALRCSGYAAMMERLRRSTLPLRESQRSATSDRQVFVAGPRGVTLELIFTLADVSAQPASI